ncbi:MAG TPA: nucleotidyl transferase AbiEii/AbiGii toxin family protein [Agriterribacter sp.]|nr:nucleotidyl transferase AbiEii/AbiGii toxin family protein [Agriterribacter sp.]
MLRGTALALKTGHRRSIDIDIFSTLPFNAPELSRHLTTTYEAKRVQTITNGVFCFINGIKTDLLAHQYPLLNAIDKTDGIRMVSLKDIGAMKLNAIYGNGSRLKDFIDIYFLLERFSLQELLDASENKYPDNHPDMVKKSLIHFEDIDFSVPVDFVNTPVKWSAIADRLKQCYANPHLKLNSRQDMIKNLPAKSKQHKKRPKRGRRL